MAGGEVGLAAWSGWWIGSAAAAGSFSLRR
uniref:Uncharacterized protein n=1 Tax=Arundo donax TaxID=35708 RepID=A0A0A9CZT1_ARUDO